MGPITFDRPALDTTARASRRSRRSRSSLLSRASRASCGSRGRDLAVVLGLVLLGCLFVTASWSRIGMALGDSHDGRNAGVWASGARALVEQGPIASRVGAVATDREGPYAHHPPGIYLEAAVARVVAGDAPAAIRAPAVLSTLASIPLLWLLLRSLHRSRTAAFCGMALAVGSPMLLLYGPMLNLEAVSLPWAAAVLLVARHAGVGRDIRRVVSAGVGFGAALTSWEGLLLCVALVALHLIVARRRGARPAPGIMWIGAGSIVSSAATSAWLAWANGGFGETLRTLRQRSGGDSASAVDFVRSQISYLGWGFPIWSILLGAIGAYLVCKDRQDGIVGALVLGVPLLYAVVLRDGAYVHAFWNYWLVLTLAVTSSFAIDRFPWSSGLPRVGAAGIALALAVTACFIETPERRSFEGGAAAGVVIDRAIERTGRADVVVWPAIGEPAWWIDYRAGTPYETVSRPGDVARAADTDPARPVLVPRAAAEAAYPGVFDRLRSRPIASRASYVAVTMADLHAVLAAAG